MTVTAPHADPKGLAPRERTLVIILAVLLVGGLIFGALTLLGGGTDEVPTVTPTVIPRITVSPTPQLTAIPETDQPFEGRDPFQPLVSEAVSAPPTDSGFPPPDSGFPPPTDTGNVPTDGNGDGTTESSARVKLLDVYKEEGVLTATVEVDGEPYTVQEGETFATNFRVLDLTTGCGTFVFGDERFQLCIGDDVRK